MASNYEITYFDAKGRAEAIRVFLHAAGIDFKDIRMKRDEWPVIKPTTPLGFVPTLKIDDVTYTQSSALARYAAKLAGFYPEDLIEALVVDEVIECISDMMNTCPWGEDGEEKKKKRIEWRDGALTKYSTFIESRIQAAGGKSVVSKPSVADFLLHGVVEGVKGGFFDYVESDFFDKFPGINAACDSIMMEPKVKAYYDSRS